QLVADLQSARAPNRSPLFQVVFALQAALPVFQFPGLTLRPLEADSGTSKFDLTLEVEETDRGLGVRLEYSTDLFKAVTMERLLGHYQVLLEGAAAAPERRLSQLPLLTEAEWRLLRNAHNRGAAASSPDPCLHHLFATQAGRCPDAVAVVCEQT